MKKLNITRKQYAESKYFTNKYGSLKYVSESGKLFKTDKGHVLKFNESRKDGWYGIKNAEFVYHGDWADPEVIYDGISLNYYDIESLLLDEYRADNPDDKNDEGFDAWMEDPRNRASIQSALDDLAQAQDEEPVDESIDDDLDEDTQALEELAKKYYLPIQKALRALREFEDESLEYAPTCEAELGEAIKNLTTVVEWMKMGATEGFSS